MEKNNLSVSLLENIHPLAAAEFTERGFSVKKEDGAFTGDALLQRVGRSAILGIRSKSQVRENEIKSLSELQAIGCFCIGTDQVDLNFARKMGVPVFNAPYSNTRSVAELVMAEIISLSRKLGDVNTKAHQGVWDKSATGSFEVRGKTLGIVGYGHIGSQVSILAEAFGLNVIFYDIEKKLPLGNSKSVPQLENLLRVSDYVSLHVPDTEETRWMMGAKQISQMKKGAVLLNLSRGKVVEIEPLVEALKSKHLAGAGIDVFPSEPDSNKEKFESPLQGLPNVILTPHIGGSTEEAQAAIGLEVATSLLRFLSTGSTQGAVNFPQLGLPKLQAPYRLVNIHNNVPGVLGQINSIVSEQGVNIAGQHLATDAEIGYLVMDLETSDIAELESRIKKLPTSLKTRVISCL